MASSRLPGKPLKSIQGKPMIEHVYERANFFKKWTKLSIATCDQKIKPIISTNEDNIDIDSDFDFFVAEMISKHWRNYKV